MSFEDLLKSLQEEYLASVPEKIAVLQGQIENASVNGLRETFHKLKGTGRTYGIPEISELAQVTESVCLEAPRDAVAAAALAIGLLKDIHLARGQQTAFAVQNDPRFEQIKKFLAN